MLLSRERLRLGVLDVALGKFPHSVRDDFASIASVVAAGGFINHDLRRASRGSGEVFDEPDP